MARVPVESGVRAEALQTVAAPKLQAVQARFDPRGDKAYQLAEALSTPAQIIDREYQKSLARERLEAQEFANSMSPDELRKKIDAGELPAWKSPVWVGTVQNTAGENASKALFREVESKIATGEFKTQKELDDFIYGRRNDMLSGKSRYEVAGFDRNFGTFRDRAVGAQNTVMTKRYETEGVQVATEDVSNSIAEITGESWNGKSDAERVAYVIGKYDRLRNARVINDDNARGVLDNALLKLAATGNKALVEEFLRTKLPNNGPSIEAFLDVRNGQATGRSVVLRNTAEREYERVVREANVRTVQATADTIINGANQRADELVSQRNGGAMQDVTVPTPDGGQKVIKGKDLVAASVERQVAANPNMDFGDQVRLFKNNGVINEGWKKEFNTAVYNIGEVTINADGKPAGTLLKGTQDALNKFAVVRQVDEQYAKDLVGEENYKILNRIQALREAGIPDMNQAAGLVNQINRRQYEPTTWGNIQKTVSSAVEDVKNPGIFSGRFWGELFRGEFGEGDKNIIPIESNVKYLAETYLAARVAPDAKTAVKMATDYMSKTVVQVNNTMYMITDLPKAPQGEDSIKWFEKYQKEVLMPRLNKMGIDPSLSDLTLLPTKGGQPMYVVSNRSMPLPSENGVGTLIVTQAEVESWIKGQIEIRAQNQATDANKQLDRRQNPVRPETVTTPGGAVMIGPAGTRKRSN
jgi:hypothetical protein